ncbi:unnamed protein product [Gordionus sp. m RMFG-2023]|uniref:uncharacterized protein LOC135928915 n=1 Tax=Gordionus sp. m RMFG-2023 TaxID=3053472 RepID=UPI0030E0DAD3
MSQAPNLIKLAFTQPIRKRPPRAKRIPYTYGDYFAVLPVRFAFNESPVFRYMCYGAVVGLITSYIFQGMLMSPANMAAFKEKKLKERITYETKFDTLDSGHH